MLTTGSGSKEELSQYSLLVIIIANPAGGGGGARGNAGIQAYTQRWRGVAL